MPIVVISEKESNLLVMFQESKYRYGLQRLAYRNEMSTIIVLLVRTVSYLYRNCFVYVKLIQTKGYLLHHEINI